MTRLAGPGAAAVMLMLLASACGGSGGGSHATSPAASASTQSVASCRQQYERWKTSAAPSALRADLAEVQSAAKELNLTKLSQALQKAGQIAASLPSPPACADPAGYYGQLVAKLKAAGAAARAQPGIAGLQKAVTQLTELPAIEQKLTAELTRTVGPNP